MWNKIRHQTAVEYSSIRKADELDVDWENNPARMYAVLEAYL
jgi:hypothetical protein